MAVESPPIIIKKIKKGGHGHHGGAWKVAFADFVTAMMAFFMLMWLLGSTTKEQQQAISHYMNDPLATNTAGGGGGKNPILDGSDGILDGKGPSPSSQAPPSDLDVPPTVGEGPASEQEAERIAEEAEQRKLESLLQDMEAALSVEALAPFKDQILLDITSEGLRIQIVDKENRPMFASGSPVLEHYTRDILREIVKVIKEVPNHISISGHTDRTPFASGNGYSNWELSADRANAARRELVAGGLSEDQLGRVVGLSSSVLFDKQNPFSPINRRISIIVMNKAAEQAVSDGEGAAVKDKEAEDAPVQPDLPPPADKAGLDDSAAPDAAPATSVPAAPAPPEAAPSRASSKAAASGNRKIAAKANRAVRHQG